MTMTYNSCVLLFGKKVTLAKYIINNAVCRSMLYELYIEILIFCYTCWRVTSHFDMSWEFNCH